LRKAVRNDPNNSTYAIRLADALADGGHNAEAMQALSRLRESDPEDAGINLHLARLAAKDNNVSDAVHYYENALYGRWTGGQVDARQRETRIELIQFLLSHQERQRALSELLILESELPQTAEAQNQTAQLFLEANDLPRALKHFVRAAHDDPGDGTALTGAGEASFLLGDYRAARHYLEAAVKHGGQNPQAVRELSIAETVLKSDPLAPRISTEERKRRTLSIFDHSLDRLQACVEQHGSNTQLESLRTKATSIEPKLRSKAMVQSTEVTRTALDLVYEIERTTNASCGDAQPADDAMLLIAHLHGGGAE
jgi:predicted Zn-dependent protease